MLLILLEKQKCSWPEENEHHSLGTVHTGSGVTGPHSMQWSNSGSVHVPLGDTYTIKFEQTIDCDYLETNIEINKPFNVQVSIEIRSEITFSSCDPTSNEPPFLLYYFSQSQTSLQTRASSRNQLKSRLHSQEEVLKLEVNILKIYFHCFSYL